MTILEDYLNSFQGIVITVSHDRYFLDNVVDRIFEFDGNGHLQQYEGGYTDYIEAKQKREVPKEEVKAKKSTGKNDWKQNRPTKLKFSYMEQAGGKTRKAGCGYDGECNELCETFGTYFRKRVRRKTVGRKDGTVGLSE